MNVSAWDTMSGSVASDTEAAREAIEVLRSLASAPKRLPCRLLFDEVGSQLYEQICETPEYYPTRTEVGILQECISAMVSDVGPNASLVEWGSGASSKTRIVLGALQSPRLYVPIDISPEILMQSARELEREYPALEVRPIVADYARPVQLPLSEVERTQPIVTFFPGSTLGNFEPEAAVEFLAAVRRAGGKRQRFILGTDLPKDRNVLEAAYDDGAGITARFNLNILNVINRRLFADFDLHRFTHRAVYKDAERRVEMQLVSRETQTATILGRPFTFERGEAIVTEHCYKYSLEELEVMANRAGYEVVQTWTDPAQRFAVHVWQPA